MNFVFLMDPPNTLNYNKDTTVALIEGVLRRGHRAFYLSHQNLSVRNDSIIFDVNTLSFDASHKLKVNTIEEMACENIDVLFIRKDPPFDEDYLFDTWILQKLKNKIAFINNPDGIMRANEKIWVTQFSDLIPDTCITSQKKHFDQFLNQHKQVVLKPINSFGGNSVFIVSINDTNRNVIFETMTSHGTKHVIVQQYLSSSTMGDKRILLLNGEFLGSVLRKHASDDHRNNFFAGGSAHQCKPNHRDMEIISRIKKPLQDMGLFFVGIDIIGDHLIEVNVTSPTCLREINHFSKSNHEDQIILFAENLSQNFKALQS